jgi:hypothetical protein
MKRLIISSVLFNDALSCWDYIESVIDRWVKEYGTLVESYWQEETELLGAFLSPTSSETNLTCTHLAMKGPQR